MSVHIHTAEELQEAHPRMSDRNARRLEEIAHERIDLLDSLDQMSEPEWCNRAGAVHDRIDKLDDEEERCFAFMDVY